MVGRRQRLWCAGFALACGIAACGGPEGPDPVHVFDTAPIQIDSVDVLLLETFPVQATVHVTGVIGDGCAELLPIQQSRDGAETALSILRRRPRDAICIQIAKLFEQTIPLEGTFAPGDHTVRVNDVVLGFRVD